MITSSHVIGPGISSSCYPTRPLGQALDGFRALPIAPESREQLLRRNGARLLGLEPS